ncbi:MAG: cytochrome c biogenesis CcdA family protein [Candidatus Dormibacteria bacterium]
MSAGDLGLAFGIGIAATASPCALPLYPGYLAFLVSGARDAGGRPDPLARWLGFFVLAGVLVAMITLGYAIAGVAVSLGRVLAFVTPVADIVVIFLGLLLLSGRNPFARLPSFRVPVSRGGSGVSAFVYGLMYGPIALPCSGPFLVSIFTLSLGSGGRASALLSFLVFGLGFGLPLLALSLLAQSRQASFVRFIARRYRWVSAVGGVLLVAVGAYDLAVNIPNARLYLGF